MNNTNAILNQSMESMKRSSAMNESTGAIIFIIIVLLWYSSSIVFLLGMQIGSSTETIEDSTKRPTKLFVQGLRDQNNNKEILKELVDKQKRDKLWDIYLGTSSDMNDNITRAETLRILNIEKKLATISENRRDNLWSSVTDLSSRDIRLRTRRRSSLDHKILEEWKILADELKAHENWPWTIQKLLIRRHLRRQRHASESRSMS